MGRLIRNDLVGGNLAASADSQPESEQSNTKSSHTTPESGRHERRGIQFGQILHAVDDLDWDPKGNDTISVPDQDDVLIEIPNGTYQTGHNVFFGTENWGIIGLGDEVTLQPPPGKCLRALHVSSNDPGRNILVENIEFDQRDGLQAGLGCSITVHDGLEIHDCSRTGMTPNRITAGPPLGQEPIGLTANVVDEDGFALIRNWTDHCETEVISYPDNAQEISVWDSSHGTVRIEDSSISFSCEHALYGSKADAVEVVGSELVSNANTNLRIAGDGSFAKDCRIGYQRDAGYTFHKRSKGRKATKIVRIEDSRDGAEGGRIEDCELFCETDGLADSKILQVMGNTGGFVIKDCTIRNSSDADGCVVDAAGSGWRNIDPPGANWVKFVNCEFVGSSENPPIKSNRSGEVHAENCTCDMPNAPKAQGLATHDISYRN